MITYLNLQTVRSPPATPRRTRRRSPRSANPQYQQKSARCSGTDALDWAEDEKSVAGHRCGHRSGAARTGDEESLGVFPGRADAVLQAGGGADGARTDRRLLE